MIFSLFMVKVNELLIKDVEILKLNIPNNLGWQKGNFSKLRKNFGWIWENSWTVYITVYIIEMKEWRKPDKLMGYFQVYPGSSNRSASSDLGISRMTAQRILSTNNYLPLNSTRVQKWQLGDKLGRIAFCVQFLLKFQEDNKFKKNS